MPTRVGLIHNHRSYRNLGRPLHPGQAHASIDARAPASKREVVDALVDFAAAGIELLIVDGGDGTVRDVLSAVPSIFGSAMPRLAVLPSGKTNALAMDLGIPATWTAADVIEAAARGSTALRSPVEIEPDDDGRPVLRGFLFGAGAFVRATSLAQHTHRWGMVNGFAVGMSLMLAVGQTFFGSANNRWRRGEAIRLRFDGETATTRRQYMVLASTLQTLPLRLKPFGPVRAGLKLLSIDAPPRRMIAGVPALLAGSTAKWLDRFGYRRRDIEQVEIDLPGDFILDGERFAGGVMTIRRGAPVEFVVP